MSRTLYKTPLGVNDVPWPCFDDEPVGDDRALIAVRAAEQRVWALTGRRFGSLQTLDERYVMPSNTKACELPSRVVGYDRRSPCCALWLAHQPARSIIEVRVDGAVVSPAGYELVGGRLYRVGACWPPQDEVRLPRVAVDYEWGEPWASSGKLAVGAQACAYYESIRTGECELPDGAVRLVRQGVQIELEPRDQVGRDGVMREGRTGIDLVDDFVSSVNPKRLVSPPKFFSPDHGAVVS